MKPREYRVWTKEEEDALREGVGKHGVGQWEVVKRDPDIAEILKERTGVQLKDKWRNLVKFKHVTKAEAESLLNSQRNPNRSVHRSHSTPDDPRTDSDGGHSQRDFYRRGRGSAERSRPRRRSRGAASSQERADLAHAKDLEVAAACATLFAANAAACVFREDADGAGPSSEPLFAAGHGGATANVRECTGAGGGSAEERRGQLAGLEAWASEAEAKVRDLEEAAAAIREDISGGREQYSAPRKPQILVPQRQSARAARIGRKRYVEMELEEEEDAEEEPYGGYHSGSCYGYQKRSRVKLGAREDTRFGIYDDRRYAADSKRGGYPQWQEDDLGPRHMGRGQMQRSLGLNSRHHQQSWDEDEYYEDYEEGGEEEQDTDVVNCVCGVEYNDGEPMVECEHCQEWAHVDCVVPGYPRTRTTPPDFRYVCAQCRAHTLTPQRPGGWRKSAGVPATPAPLTPAMQTPHRHHPAFAARGAGGRAAAAAAAAEARDAGGANDAWARGREELAEYRRGRPAVGTRGRALFVDDGDWSDHHGPQYGRSHALLEPESYGRRRKDHQTEAWGAELLGGLWSKPAKPAKRSVPVAHSRRKVGKRSPYMRSATQRPRPPGSKWPIKSHLRPLAPWAWSATAAGRFSGPPPARSGPAAASSGPHVRQPRLGAMTPPPQGLPPMQPSPPAGFRRMPVPRHTLPLAPSRSTSEGEPMIPLFQTNQSTFQSGFTPWNKDALTGARGAPSPGLPSRPSPTRLQLPSVRLLNGRGGDTGRATSINPFKGSRGRSATPGLKSSASVGALERQDGEGDRVVPARTHSDEANHYENFEAEDIVDSDMLNHAFDTEDNFDIHDITDTLRMLRHPNQNHMEGEEQHTKFPFHGLDSGGPVPALFCGGRGEILEDAADARHLDQPGGTSPTSNVRHDSWLSTDWDEARDAPPMPPKKAAAAAARSAEIAMLHTDLDHHKAGKLLHPHPRHLFAHHTLTGHLPDVPDDVEGSLPDLPPAPGKSTEGDGLDGPLGMGGNAPFATFSTMAQDDSMFQGHETDNFHQLLSLASDDVREEEGSADLLMGFATEHRGKTAMHDLDDDPGMRSHARLDRRKLVGSSGED